MVSAEIPLPVILSLLEAPRPSNLQYVLKSLYLSQDAVSKASKSDLNILTSRINNLLLARDDYKRWYGCHVVQILALNPVVLTNAGSLFIVSLLKIVNDTNSVSINLKNAALTLNAIIKGIRGKPVLTREVLTPNLPNIISSLMDTLERDIVTILPILQSILFKHSTTFKPFAKKFEVKLQKFITENFDNLSTPLQYDLCKSYAYLNLIKPNNSTTASGTQPLPDDQWRAKLLKIMDEIRSTVLIYDNFIDLKNERDTMEIIKQLPDQETKEYIFPFLNVDMSEPITVVSISQRLNVLVKLLIAFVTSPTPFPIRVPLGLVIQVANLLLGVSPNYIPFKGDLKRDQDLKKIVLNDMVKTQAIGSQLIFQVTKFYKKLVLPHLSSILSSLEVAVPVKSGSGKKMIKIDTEAALAIESELLSVVKTTTEILKLFEGLTELELINKLVDVCILFLEKRTPMESLTEKQSQVQPKQAQGQGKKNKKKSKDSTPLSDLLSHAELFELDPPAITISTSLSFFEVVIKKIPSLSPTARIKVMRYILSTGVKQSSLNGSVSPQLVRLLEALVLYPGNGETYSVLPIVKRLLPDNEKLSLLTNPRFPPLEVKYRPRAAAGIEDVDDDDEDDEAREDIMDVDVVTVEEVEQEPKGNFAEELKKAQVSIPDSTQSVFKTNEETKQLQTLSFPEAKKEEKIVEEEDEENKTRSLEDAEEEDETPSKRIKITQGPTITTTSTTEIEVKIDESEGGDDSDFEVPEIDLGSDEDDEDDE